MVPPGSETERTVEDIMLIRYACYLIAQNGDPWPRKGVILLEKNKAALKIQGFFASYSLKKQTALHQVIANSPHSRLLQALHLRFQCMRAVAAAKFPLNKPLEDKEQIVRVINAVTTLAEEKGISNLSAVAQIFQHSILLSTRVQVPYYDIIWRKSHYGERDIQTLINHAYIQLHHLVLSFNLPIDCLHEKECYTPEEVLALARDIIQYASKTMIEILANPTRQELHAISQAEFGAVIEKMLANYMAPTNLAQEMTECSSMSASSLEAKL